MKEKEMTIRDAITAGILKAFNLEVTPQYDGKEVTFKIRGNVDEALRKISEDMPIGSRSALEAIKNMRSAIFLYKQGGRNA